eukprot:4427111-Alexandrium_andersonii.AAC.1
MYGSLCLAAFGMQVWDVCSVPIPLAAPKHAEVKAETQKAHETVIGPRGGFFPGLVAAFGAAARPS